MYHSPQAMHVPDGFLSVFVAILLWALSATIIAIALKRVSRELGERQAPLMGVLAAAIFAGQMLNFTVAGGTSGHLMGAALATILVGPWAAILVLTSVVSVQALIFQDGGLLALGANIFNMAIVGVSVAYMAYRSVLKVAGRRSWGEFLAGFLAAWLSIEVAALGVGLQLALSGTSPANIALPAMGGIHALIGIGEGLITVGALAFLYASRRDLVTQESGSFSGSRGIWLVGLLLAVLMAVASPLASSHPDGLEWVAGQYGFLQNAQEPLYEIIPDYVIPGVSNQALATILAGVLGVALVFAVTLLTARIRRRRT